MTRPADTWGIVLWVIIVILPVAGSHAQQASDTLVTFEHIAPIIHQHCTPCHRPEGSGPFNLLSYEDVANKAGFIQYVTSIGYMPPWLADINYRHHQNTRVLSETELQLIADWVEQGAQPGGQHLAQDSLLAIYQQANAADLVLKMNQPFTIPGTNEEQFRVFVIPTNLTEDKWVSGIRFVPGNKKLAHHARIMIDTTHLLRADDGIRVGEASAIEEYKVRLWDYFWHGWVPGNEGVYFPEGTARRLPANSDIVINMHYSPTAVAEDDQSEIHIYYTDEKVEREVKTYVMDEKLVKNQPFKLPADTVITFYMRSPVVKNDLSIIAVLPHMHVLGTKFKAFAITPDSKSIPLVKIKNWDFNWQMDYQFDPLVKVPKGSVIYAQATYDNTEQNLANPYSPPKTVEYGWGTYDEMMNFIFQYVDYRPEDEHDPVN